jgi:hypothetical protein
MEDFDFNQEEETIEEIQRKNKEFMEDLLKQYEGKEFKKYEDDDEEYSDDYNHPDKDCYSDSGNEDNVDW